jgi:antitoxin (DNA-binding transcriptional repressor) of toxin-antitoxin stability system
MRQPLAYRVAHHEWRLLYKVASRSYLETMRAVGLKVLKNRLSEYVRIASSGETILVTDRERVVAELVPPREGRAESTQDALLADAVRKGWLTPAVGSAGGPPPRRPVTTLRVLLEELADDRADR